VHVVSDSAALANRLRAVLLQLGRELRREGQALGVTPAQVSLLEAIRADPGLAAADLAERERVSPAAMSGLLVRLEASRLIVRTRAADRRRIGLALTPEGEKVVRSIRGRRTSLLARRLEGLTPEQRDRIEGALGPLGALLDGPAAKA
jgi:DNA-binding MarR family transcriptional regulator